MAQTLRGPRGDPSPADTMPSAAPDEGDPLVGTALGGKYQITALLARGGMGTVYEAKHTRLQRRFAVKVLSIESQKQADAVPRFKREAEAASAIGHANIIDVVDIDRTEDGRWYMVMELLQGEELRARMSRMGQLPLPEVVEIAAQLAGALDAAHSRGIVHRDLKPENIFLLPRETGAPVVKVLDFGISKVRDADQSLTRPGEVIGTPYYMAPEQARGDRAVDHRADIFALGAVVYEAIVGRPPFEGTTPNEVLRAILLSDPPAPSSVGVGLDERIVAVLMRSLAKDPADRFQSGHELAEALAQAARCDAPPSSSTSEPGPATPTTEPQTGRYGPVHLALAFVLGMLVCALTLAGIWAALR